MILPSSNLETAHERAEQVCSEVRSLQIGTDRGPLSITISAGVASFPEHGDTQKQLIAQADKALYRAKQAGRDRIELAGVATAA